jgi:hypothetical protein
MNSYTELLKIALSMYSGEPCRICERVLTPDDIVDGAVFVGYSDDNKSRAAHRVCFRNAKNIFEKEREG